MAPERSGTVMVLSMYVIGECTTEGNEACPGRGWRKTPLWDHKTQNIRKADPRLRAQNASLGFEADQPIKAAHIDQRARTVETTVAIGSSHPDRQFAGAANIADQVGQFVAKARSRNQ